MQTNNEFPDTPLTISALTTHLVSLFERDDRLRDVWVIGEVSNWKRAASGHIYFGLKDSGATISAVMWRGNASSHSWLPDAGDQVMAHGYVGIYPERGVYQLYVNRLQPAGRGQLYAQFEELKQRLAADGLFDADRKRPLVTVPQRIGIVTSADAAALRDILRVLAARWPLIDLILFPSLVQGSDAPAQIAHALQSANRYSRESEPLDGIILARGGGSIEDLWTFNEEIVARAMAHSELPIVTGVGHETDFTIADFVADVRMPTPSAAAAAVAPDGMAVRDELRAVQHHLAREAMALIDIQHERLMQHTASLRRLHPQRQLDQRRQQLADRERRLHETVQRTLHQQIDRTAFARLRLGALNPLAVLQRGYSVVQQMDGRVVTAPSDLAAGERLQVRAAGGSYAVQVVSDE